MKNLLIFALFCAISFGQNDFFSDLNSTLENQEGQESSKQSVKIQTH